MKTVDAASYFWGDPGDVEAAILRSWVKRIGAIMLSARVHDKDVLDDWADYEIRRAAHNGLQLDRDEVLEYGREALASLKAEIEAEGNAMVGDDGDRAVKEKR